MKTKNAVGLYGKFHGLLPKLNVDLPSSGYTPFFLDKRELAHPFGTVSVICAAADTQPNQNRRGEAELADISSLLDSLQEDRVHVIFVSVANSNRPEDLVSSFGHLNLQTEELVRNSGLPYTIVRVMSADDRPGHHHKLFWKQDFEGQQKGQMHPVPWEDLSQILIQCVNRPEVLSKTFTVHAVAGEPGAWDHWFQGLEPDSERGASTRVHSA